MSDSIQCLLVDDKPLGLDMLAAYVAQMPTTHQAGRSENPVRALSRVAHVADFSQYLNVAAYGSTV
ncbi:MAG: hypothetical protein EOO60_12220 [Hymenobacter sp.]|nr:MAG: hypothetical protein EOO60_12220 [Hymenobacter sp.]